MSLAGSQVELLKEALLDAFDQASLAEMVRVHLDQKLAVIAGGSNLAEIVFNLIAWAERTGSVSQLVTGAVAANPGNTKLQVFAAQYAQSMSNGHSSAGEPIYSSLADLGGQDANVITPTSVNQSSIAIQPVMSEAELRDLDNRRVLRQMVTRYWIDGVLKSSLNHGPPIQLTVVNCANAVQRVPNRAKPYSVVDQDAVLPNASIIDIFDRMNQRLLILGETGAGKTTLMLLLAEELIKRVDSSPLQHSPVVFNLSSWSQRRAPLATWLVDELGQRYNIPTKTAQRWVQDDKLLLLFDGLDEVEQHSRNQCATAINEYLDEHFVPIVVCCRKADYDNLASGVDVSGAVEIQPLSDAQILTYFDQDDRGSSAVYQTISQDPELFALARSPLMLSIMNSVYRHSVAAAPDLVGALPSSYELLADAYIRQVFLRRESKPAYTAGQTVQWLQWLAVQLTGTGQTTFLIERIQPTWLSIFGRRRLVADLIPLASPVYGAIVGLLAGGLFTFLALALHSDLDIRTLLSLGILIGSAIGSAWMIIDVISGKSRAIYPQQQARLGGPRFKSILYSAIYWGLMAALLVGGFDGFRGQLMSAPQGGAIMGIRGHLGIGILGALSNFIIGAAFGSVIGVMVPIEPLPHRLNVRRISHVQAVFGLSVALLAIGLASLATVFTVALHLALGKGIQPTELTEWVAYVTVGLVGGAIEGLLFQQLEVADLPVSTETLVPNQGILLAARRSLIAGILFGAAGATIYGISFGSVDGLTEGLLVGLGAGITGFLLAGFVFGAPTVAKHLLVRLGLRIQCHVPWNYALFLDYAASLAFLRKVGGGYIFYHRLFLDHFASLSKEDIERLTRK